MKFRKDINGLRAISVIAVVLFHFNSSWMPGGFSGVDVFFVISGFLMTGIIFRGIEKENFSILNFYVARANRIIPALAVLCLVLLIFGWFYLSPIEYRALGRHAASSMVFLSNIIYWNESGYFNAASQENWLLHTWSLSTEWKFYIIYPLILVAMRKFMPVKAMKATVFLGTVLGFIFCVIATYKWPSASYYLLPTRAWEMMIGGVAYLYPFTIQEKRKKLLEWLGLTFIVGSYFLISKEDPWPGYLAIFPVLGSFLIIQAQRNDSLITSNVVLQKLGDWSYSIYLWHWPFVVAIYYFSLNNTFIYLALTLSVLLGFLSNKYIEKIKFKNDFYNLFTYLKCKPVSMFLVVVVIGSGVFTSNGLEGRSNNNQYSINDIKEKLKPNYGLNITCVGKFSLSANCRTSESPEILVWGDSFSMHLVSGILASNPEAKIIQMTKSTCGPFFNITKVIGGGFADDCLEFTGNVKKWLQSNTSVKYAVLSSPFNYANSVKVKFRSGIVKNLNSDEVSNQFRLTLREFDKLGITPVVFYPPPRAEKNIGKCLDRKFYWGDPLSLCDFNKNLIVESQNVIYDWLSELEPKYKVVKLNDYLCSGGICKTHVGKVFIYRDQQHLSYEGSKKLGKEMGFYNLIIGKPRGS